VDDETGLHGLHFKMFASGLAVLFLVHLLLAFAFLILTADLQGSFI